MFKLIHKEVKVLAKYPETGRKTNNKDVRKKSIKDYFLYYGFNNQTLKVLAIVDMRRNQKFLKRFEDD